MSKAPIPAIVVGTGFGCRVHVPALRAAGFEVVALVGTNEERLVRKAQECGIPEWFTSLDQAIDQTKAKAVSIATPPSTHAELAMVAIGRGCHVICEKPFALAAQEGRRLLMAADDAGIVNFVAHEFRWQPERIAFGQAIAGGLIGDPRYLVINQFLPMCADPSARLPAWWFNEDFGGGWLGAGGSHIIDQIRVWFGEFESVSAALFNVSDRDRGAEDTYSIRFRLASGLEGSLQQSAGTWGPPSSTWRCAGTQGTVWIDGGKVHLSDKSGTRELPVPELHSADSVAQEGGKQLPFELATFIQLAIAFRKQIEGEPRGTAVQPATFDDGQACLIVMDMIRASAKAGGLLKSL